MQYEPGTEKVAMMSGPNNPISRPLTVTENPQLQRSRKILLVMLGICLGLCLVTTIVGLVNRTENPKGRFQLSLPLFSILFYGFGLLVAYKYSETGLRVFGWLGVIMLVGMGIVLGFLFITVLAGLAITSMVFVALDSIDVNTSANSTVVNSTTISSGDRTMIKGALVGISTYAIVIFLTYIGIFIFTVIMVTFAFRLARLIGSKNVLIIQQI